MNQNGVETIVDKRLKDEVVDIKGAGDRIILIKVVLGDEFISIISTYASQAWLYEATKQRFWADINRTNL